MSDDRDDWLLYGIKRSYGSCAMMGSFVKYGTEEALDLTEDVKTSWFCV